MPPPPGWPKQCMIERCHESVDDPQWDTKRHCWRTLAASETMMEWGSGIECNVEGKTCYESVCCFAGFEFVRSRALLGQSVFLWHLSHPMPEDGERRPPLAPCVLWLAPCLAMSWVYSLPHCCTPTKLLKPIYIYIYSWNMLKYLEILTLCLLHIYWWILKTFLQSLPEGWEDMGHLLGDQRPQENPEGRVLEQYGSLHIVTPHLESLQKGKVW